MRSTNMKNALLKARMVLGIMAAVASLTGVSNAAAPGITGPSFSLVAQPAYLTQPDGQSIYSWGYGCSVQPAGWAPSAITPPSSGCPGMQVPGPTLIVTEGDTVSVALTNNLPASAGNTSILFPGFTMLPFTDGTPGLVTQEAAHGSSVTYKFVASSPGTRSYYSGTQSDLQVEMGMYGAVIVLPKTVPTTCSTADLRAKSERPEPLG